MEDRIRRLADDLLTNAFAAQEAFLEFGQERVDKICHAIFEAAFDARFDLAERAIKETRLGVYEHKVIKNAWASLVVYDSIRHLRTAGVVSRDEASGITEVAYPRGPILALLPVTNPTSTAVFKILICMKTRNPIILSPHGFARKCVSEAATICYDAARSAGAPEHCIQWLKMARKDLFDELTERRRLALILATTTRDMVKRAERSATPAFGVGPGNVPIYVDKSADMPEAARKTVHSKTFDNGTVCASEQALIVTDEVWPLLRPELEKRGTFVCTEAQAEALGPVCYSREARSMRADAVGQPAAKLAEKARIDLPEGVRMLLAPAAGVGHEHPLSNEILAPVLTLYVVKSFEEALVRSKEVLRFGGAGHTAGIYATDQARIDRWSEALHAGRMLINIPTTTGAIGGVMNRLDPSLTLGCGTAAGNISIDNITVSNLLNICRITEERANETWMKLYPDLLLDRSVRSDKALPPE